MWKWNAWTPAPSVRALSADLHDHRHPARFGRPELDVGGGRQGRARQALDTDRDALRLLGRVHQLHAIDVLDPAGADLARQGAAVAHDVGPERRPRREAEDERRRDGDEHAAVGEDARPRYVLPHVPL